MSAACAESIARAGFCAQASSDLVRQDMVKRRSGHHCMCQTHGVHCVFWPVTFWISSTIMDQTCPNQCMCASRRCLPRCGNASMATCWTQSVETLVCVRVTFGCSWGPTVWAACAEIIAFVASGDSEFPMSLETGRCAPVGLRLKRV